MSAQNAAVEAWIAGIVRDVAELPDRNSPEGQPEMMLVTGDELREIILRTPPEGFQLVPAFRGYAHLGTGQYFIDTSNKDEPPELIISVASEADRVGRVVGDERPNPPGKMLLPEEMAVRLRFESVAGLDALEKHLRYLREDHFPEVKQEGGAE